MHAADDEALTVHSEGRELYVDHAAESLDDCSLQSVIVQHKHCITPVSCIKTTSVINSFTVGIDATLYSNIQQLCIQNEKPRCR